MQQCYTSQQWLNLQAGYQYSVHVKGEDFIGQLSDCQILKMDAVPWIQRKNGCRWCDYSLQIYFLLIVKKGAVGQCYVMYTLIRDVCTGMDMSDKCQNDICCYGSGNQHQEEGKEDRK